MVRPLALTAAISLLLNVAGTNAAPCDEIANGESRLACYDNAARCQKESSDNERLACFDRAFDQAQPVSPVNSNAAVSAVAKPAKVAPKSAVVTSSRSRVEEKTVTTSQTERSQAVTAARTTPEVVDSKFGLPDRRSTENAEYIEATIVRVQTNANRIDYIKLDSGQIWREVEDGRLRFKKGQQIRIEKGLLSSYKMSVVGKNMSVKVKRVK